MTEPYAGELVRTPAGWFAAEWIGVPGEGEPVAIESFDALAEHVRTDERGRYRPLSGARTLRRGWKFHTANSEEREQALEVVYPLATTHARQFERVSLRVVSLDDVLSRQSGRYESTSGLSAAGRERAQRLVCGECVRTPVWAKDEVGDVDSSLVGAIPCPEPCSVLVAFCREAALWQEDPPSLAKRNPETAWAAFEEPGNELREHYLAEGPINHD